MHLYGFFIGVAIVCGASVFEWAYKLLGGRQKDVTSVVYMTITFGIIGARLYYVIDYWSYYRDHLTQIPYLWQGGLGIWGGVVTGFCYLILTFWKKRDELLVILGASSVALPIAQSIGRVANAVNNEFGEKVGLFPWWSVEMGLNMLLFCLIVYLLVVRKSTKTSLIATYLIGYGSIRFFLEYFRQVSWEVLGMPVASIFSLISVIIGAWLILVNARGLFAICRSRVGGLIFRL